MKLHTLEGTATLLEVFLVEVADLGVGEGPDVPGALLQGTSDGRSLVLHWEGAVGREGSNGGVLELPVLAVRVQLMERGKGM